MGNTVEVGLPPRPFLYTLDQIALLLDMTLDGLKRDYCHFQGRSLGRSPASKLLARDIAAHDAPAPDWRVSETELRRWLRWAGFRLYDRTRIR